MLNSCFKSMGYYFFKVCCYAVLSTLLLAACGEQRSSEDIVRERAQGWVDALLQKDLEGAYAFTSPVYRQSSRPGVYHARVSGAASWTGAEVNRVTCEQDTCTVRVLISYAVAHMKVSNTRPMDYTWVQHEGEWWLYVPGK